MSVNGVVKLARSVVGTGLAVPKLETVWELGAILSTVVHCDRSSDGMVVFSFSAEPFDFQRVRRDLRTLLADLRIMVLLHAESFFTARDRACGPEC